MPKKLIDSVNVAFFNAYAPKRSPAGDKYAMVEQDEIYDSVSDPDGFSTTDQQFKQLIQAQNLAAARQDVDFPTSGDAGYFDRTKFDFFSPIGSLKVQPVPEKSTVTKVDPKIHRRKLNLDD